MENEIVIFGYSDDLIEVEGWIGEEWNWIPKSDTEKRYVIASDGTVLSAVYDHDGLWRFNRVAVGSARYSKTEAVTEDDNSDKITLIGDITWVALATEFKAK